MMGPIAIAAAQAASPDVAAHAEEIRQLIRCPRENNEIVVCGKPLAKSHRLEPESSGPADAEGFRPFEFNLSPAARAGLVAKQTTLPNGMSGPSLQATLKIRFF